MAESFIHSSLAKEKVGREDPSFEVPIRPQTLSEFAGQDQVRHCLDVFVGAAKQRGETLGHCLFSSPPSFGKDHFGEYHSEDHGVQFDGDFGSCNR